jgi:hypothetical protein
MHGRHWLVQQARESRRANQSGAPNTATSGLARAAQIDSITSASLRKPVPGISDVADLDRSRSRCHGRAPPTLDCAAALFQAARLRPAVLICGPKPALTASAGAMAPLQAAPRRVR